MTRAVRRQGLRLGAAIGAVVLVTVAVVALVLVAYSAYDSPGSPPGAGGGWQGFRGPSVAAPVAPSSTTTAPVPSATKAAPPAPPPAPTIGEGTWLVGPDVTPGTYQATVPANSVNCYWERKGKDPSDILENDNVKAGGRATVRILKSDWAFQSDGCGTWKKVSG